MPSHLKPVDALLAESWKRYRARAGTLALMVLTEIGISIAVAIPTLVVVVALVLTPVRHIMRDFITPALVGLGTSPIGLENFTGDFARIMSAVFLLLIIMFVVGSWLTAAFWSLVMDETQHEIGPALAAGWRALPRMMGAEILRGLAVVGGFILFVIPGILFSGWFLFSAQEVLAGAGPARALGTSRALVRGRWWALVLRLVLASVILTVPLMIFQVPSTILTQYKTNSVAMVLVAIFGFIYFIVALAISFIGKPWLYVFKHVLREDAQRRGQADPSPVFEVPVSTAP